MSLQPISGENLPKSHLPFSPAIRAGNLLFVSGQASVDDTGKLVSDTFEKEFRRSMDNVKRILAAAGCSLQDVVQVKSYVKNASDVPEYNKLYREYFTEPYPARTTIVNCLGTLLYEIDVIAYSPRA